VVTLPRLRLDYWFALTLHTLRGHPYRCAHALPHLPLRSSVAVYTTVLPPDSTRRSVGYAADCSVRCRTCAFCDFAAPDFATYVYVLVTVYPRCLLATAIYHRWITRLPFTTVDFYRLVVVTRLRCCVGCVTPSPLAILFHVSAFTVPTAHVTVDRTLRYTYIASVIAVWMLIYTLHVGLYYTLLPLRVCGYRYICDFTVCRLCRVCWLPATFDYRDYVHHYYRLFTRFAACRYVTWMHNTAVTVTAVIYRTRYVLPVTSFGLPHNVTFAVPAASTRIVCWHTLHLRYCGLFCLVYRVAICCSTVFAHTYVRSASSPFAD